MGTGKVILLAVAVTLTFGAASAQGDDEDMRGCIIDGQRGVVDCRGASDQGQREDESPWTSPLAQTLYALLGFALSGGAFFLGWNRVRTRRRTMHQLLTDVETTYATSKDEPQAGIEHLVGIRSEVKIRHENGRLGDSQYLALTNKVNEYITKLRILALEIAFPNLPAALMSEIRTVLEDSHLSASDVQRIEQRAIALRVSANTRKQLAQHLQKWAASEQPPPATIELVPTMVSA